MANTIVRAVDLDIGSITFSDVKTLDNGTRMIYISYKNNKFFMQLPNLVASYGLSVWPADRPGGVDKMHLDLSLTGYDTENSTVQSFFQKMSEFDELLVDAAMLNSKTWFRKTFQNREVAQALFTPLIKYSKDKNTGEISTKYPPVVRLQIPRNKKGEIDVEIYDTNRTRLNFDDIDFKRAQVTAIVQISSVWLINGKFGVSMKIQQMKVNQNQNSLVQYAFANDSDDEANE